MREMSPQTMISESELISGYVKLVLHYQLVLCNQYLRAIFERKVTFQHLQHDPIV